jgi:hypothetical protein
VIAHFVEMWLFILLRCDCSFCYDVIAHFIEMWLFILLRCDCSFCCDVIVHFVKMWLFILLRCDCSFCWDVIVHFIHIVDHHCLNFLFIKPPWKFQYWKLFRLRQTLEYSRPEWFPSRMDNQYMQKQLQD